MALNISFNSKISFNHFEKMSIRYLLQNNLSYPPFYNLATQSTCINVIKSFHQDETDTYPHFNISFYHPNSQSNFTTYHVYVDLEAEKIKKITYISIL